MKKLWVGLVGLPLAGAFVAVANFYVLHPKARAAPNVTLVSSPEIVARGRYLAHHVLGCVACHSPIDEERPGDFIIEEKLLAGRVFPEMPEMIPGRLVAPNLTPEDATGIGAWTDGELMRAIREGVSRDGRPLFPMMSYAQYRHVTDEDTLAVIAYLRSVPPIRNALPRTEIDFPVSMFVRTVPKPLDAAPPPWPDEPVARGQLLLKVMGCEDCHTPMERGTPLRGMRLAGGNAFSGPFGVVYASNITAHDASGVGAYSDDDLRRVFREGRSKSGRSLWVMPWSVTQGLEERDLDALIAAMRTIPANPNLVPGAKLEPGYEGRPGALMDAPPE